MRLLKRWKPQRDAFFEDVRGRISRIGDGLEQKYNISGRIAAANHWCEEHPRKMFGVTLCVLIICVSVSFLLPSKPGDDMGIDFGTIRKGASSVEILSRNNNEAYAFQSEYVELMKGVQADINLIDSLSRKSEMSHDDSVKIYAAAQRLNYFQKNMNNEN